MYFSIQIQRIFENRFSQGSAAACSVVTQNRQSPARDPRENYCEPARYGLHTPLRRSVSKARLPGVGHVAVGLERAAFEALDHTVLSFALFCAPRTSGAMRGRFSRLHRRDIRGGYKSGPFACHRRPGVRRRFTRSGRACIRPSSTERL